MKKRAYLKEKVMTDSAKWIDNDVKTNDVVLFMTGTPDLPMCGFSGRATQILNHLGVPFKGINVLDSDEVRQRSRNTNCHRAAALC
jgi:monothiol glutaredoxin